MPPGSIRFVKAAWMWFAVGLGLGALLVAAKAGLLPSRLFALRATHVHVMAVAWGAQWVFGIAFWIYPARGPERTGPQAERATLACWCLLNGGTVIRLVGEAAHDFGILGPMATTGLVTGAAMQLLAGLLFVVLIRRRIRPARWIRHEATGDTSDSLPPPE